MALSTKFFYDGISLDTSTKLYIDKLGLVAAPNGFYRENGIVREYLNGEFVSSDTCDCPNNCDYMGELTSASRIVYDANFDVGSSTGAIVLRATPTNKNFGMSATYNSTTYKDVYVGGSLLATAGDFVIWGNTPSFSENCPNIYTDQTYTNVPNYIMSNNIFYASGSIPTVIALTSQVFNTGLVLGMIIIPKTSSVINDLSVRWYGLCPDYAANIEGNCVEALTPFEVYSDPYETEIDACSATPKAPDTYYCVKRNPSEPNIMSYDVAFQDDTATTPMPSGYYIYSVAGPNKNVINIGANGIILSITECK